MFELIALNVVALKISFGDPTEEFPRAAAIVWAPRFLPLLEAEELGVGELLVRLGIFFLGWRRKPPVHGKGGPLPGENLFDRIELLSRAGLTETILPHISLWLDICGGLDIFFNVTTPFKESKEEIATLASVSFNVSIPDSFKRLGLFNGA